MKFITLTLYLDNTKIFINPTCIGHIYEVEKTKERGKHTIVSTTSHNNGGFKIAESAEEILKKINEN